MEEEVFDLESISNWQPDFEWKQLEALKASKFVEHASTHILQRITANIENFQRKPQPSSVSATLLDALSAINTTWKLSLSPDGQNLALLMDDILVVWHHEMKTGRQVALTFETLADSCTALRKICWSPDSKFVAVGYSHGSVCVYGTKARSLVLTIQNDSKDVGKLCPAANVFLAADNSILVVFMNCVARYYTFSPSESPVVIAWNEDAYNQSASLSFEFTFMNHTVITTANYNPLLNILVVGGQGCLGKDSSGDRFVTSEISVWKISAQDRCSRPLFKFKSSFEVLDLHGWKGLRDGKKDFHRALETVVASLDVSWENMEALTCDTNGNITVWALQDGKILKREHDLDDLVVNRWTSRFVQQSTGAAGKVYLLKYWKSDKILLGFIGGNLKIVSTPLMEPMFSHELGSNVLFTADGYSSIERMNILICKTRSAQVSFNSSGKMIDLHAQNEQETAMSSRLSLSQVWTFLLTLLRYMINVLLWHWEGESLFYSNKKHTFPIRDFTLFRFEENTPLQLFLKKIKAKNFELAEKFAEKYMLDKSEIYKAQWLANEVTQDSIFIYLDKVLDRKWRVEQCTTRIASDPTVQQTLYEYGLARTNILDELDIDSSLSSWDEKFGKVSLDSSQLELAGYRRRLLKSLDRLNTWNQLKEKAGRQITTFQKTFKYFRDSEIIDMAIFYARNEYFDMLQVLVELHTSDVSPYRFQLLDSIPLSCKVDAVSFLIPAVVGGKESVPGFDFNRIRRNPDWSECDVLKSHINGPKNTSLSLYDKSSYPATDLFVIQEWYERRIISIDEDTGLLDEALTWAKFAIDHGVKLQSELLSTATVLDKFILRTPLQSFEYDLISVATLGQFMEMSPEDRLKHFLQRGIEKTRLLLESDLLLEDLQSFVFPYSVDVGIKEVTALALLEESIKTDDYDTRFCIISALLRASLPPNVFSEMHLIPTLGLYIKGLISIIPGYAYEDMIDLISSVKNTELDQLRDRLQICLDIRYVTASFTLGDIEALQSQPKSFLPTVQRISKAILGSGAAKQQIKILWDLVIRLRNLALPSFPLVEIQINLILGILLSGETSAFELGKSLVFGQSSLEGWHQLSTDEIEQLVLRASREYSDNDFEGDISKAPLSYAILCLNIVADAQNRDKFKKILAEIEFLQAVNRICKIYKLSMNAHDQLFPMKIRMHNNKVDLVVEVITQKKISINDAISLLESLLKQVDLSPADLIKNKKLLCSRAFEIYLRHADNANARGCIRILMKVTKPSDRLEESNLLDMSLKLLDVELTSDPLANESVLSEVLLMCPISSRGSIARLSPYLRSRREADENFNAPRTASTKGMHRHPFYQNMGVLAVESNKGPSTALEHDDELILRLLDQSDKFRLNGDEIFPKAFDFLSTKSTADRLAPLRSEASELVMSAFSFEQFRKENTHLVGLLGEKDLRELLNDYDLNVSSLLSDDKYRENVFLGKAKDPATNFDHLLEAARMYGHEFASNIVEANLRYLLSAPTINWETVSKRLDAFTIAVEDLRMFFRTEILPIIDRNVDAKVEIDFLNQMWKVVSKIEEKIGLIDPDDIKRRLKLLSQLKEVKEIQKFRFIDCLVLKYHVSANGPRPKHEKLQKLLHAFCESYNIGFDTIYNFIDSINELKFIDQFQSESHYHQKILEYYQDSDSAILSHLGSITKSDVLLAKFTFLIRETELDPKAISAALGSLDDKLFKEAALDLIQAGLLRIEYEVPSFQLIHALRDCSCELQKRPESIKSLPISVDVLLKYYDLILESYPLLSKNDLAKIIRALELPLVDAEELCVAFAQINIFVCAMLINFLAEIHRGFISLKQIVIQTMVRTDPAKIQHFMKQVEASRLVGLSEVIPPFIQAVLGNVKVYYDVSVETIALLQDEELKKQLLETVQISYILSACWENGASDGTDLATLICSRVSQCHNDNQRLALLFLGMIKKALSPELIIELLTGMSVGSFFLGITFLRSLDSAGETSNIEGSPFKPDKQSILKLHVIPEFNNELFLEILDERVRRASVLSSLVRGLKQTAFPETVLKSFRSPLSVSEIRIIQKLSLTHDITDIIPLQRGIQTHRLLRNTQTVSRLKEQVMKLDVTSEKKSIDELLFSFLKLQNRHPCDVALDILNQA